MSVREGDLPPPRGGPEADLLPLRIPDVLLQLQEGAPGPAQNRVQTPVCLQQDPGDARRGGAVSRGDTVRRRVPLLPVHGCLRPRDASWSGRVLLCPVAQGRDPANPPGRTERRLPPSARGPLDPSGLKGGRPCAFRTVRPAREAPRQTPLGVGLPNQRRPSGDTLCSGRIPKIHHQRPTGW